MPERDEVGRKSENKILVSNSIHIRSEYENSEKNSKNTHKITKPIPGIISGPNGMW